MHIYGQNIKITSCMHGFHGCRHTEKKRQLSANHASAFREQCLNLPNMPIAMGNCSTPADSEDVMVSPRANKKLKMTETYGTLNQMCTDADAEMHSQETIREMAKKSPDTDQLSKYLLVCIYICMHAFIKKYILSS